MDTTAVEVEFKPQENQSNEGFFGRLVQLPFLKTTLSEASKLYCSTRERNILTKCTFSAAEMGTKMAFNTTKLALKVIPDNLKTKIEDKVQAVGDIACHGLDVIQRKFPIVTGETNLILLAGTETVEKSELVEVVLTVAEALLDCVPHTVEQQEASACPFRVLPQKKLDRMKVIPSRTGRAMKYVVLTGGQKVFWTVALLPLHATYMWIDGVKYLLSSSVAPAGTVLSHVPLVKSLVPVYPKLRRSQRRKVKVNYKRLLSKSPNPFPAISPDKKRKREGAAGFEEDETSTYALYDDDNEYCSAEDPDYDPEKDEEAATTSDTASSSTADSGEASDMDEADVEGEAQSAHDKATVFQNGAAKNAIEALKTLKQDENKNEKQAQSDKVGSSKGKMNSSELHSGGKTAEEKVGDKKSFVPKSNTGARPSPDKAEKRSPLKSPSTKLTAKPSPDKAEKRSPLKSPSTKLTAKPAPFKGKTPPKAKSSPLENKENLAKSKSFPKGAEPLKESKRAERDVTGKQLESAVGNSQTAKGKAEKSTV